MDPEKLIEMQRQMRRNNVDLGDFINDLESWEDEVKKKDEFLKTSAAKGQQDLPPVRNSLEQKRKKKKKKPPKDKSAKQQEPTKKRISGYDFRSWDKFDVDKAIEEIDNKDDSSASEYETDEEWEMERKRLLAVQHKDQGNQLFKEGKYVQAIEQYTKAIEFDPTNAVLPSNRAMALIKQEKYAAAELDCTMSISLDDAYVKAYHRRGTARAALKKYKEAKQDFEKVLKLDPKSKQARQELEKMERLLNPPKVLETKGVEASDVGMVKAVYKPPKRRSKKPLRRIAIEEIGEDEEEEERRRQMSSAQAQQSQTKQRITAKDNAQFDLLLSSENSTLNSPLQTEKVNETLDKKPKRIDIIDDNDTPDIKQSETADNNETEDESLKLNLNQLTGDTSISTSSVATKSVVSPSSSPRVPPVPTSSYQFQADWKVLKNTEKQFYQYFKEIKPSLLPKLFGQSLDSDVLVKIFTTLQDFYIPNGDDVYEPLKYLCDVSRFSMTIMFMSSREKTVLKEVLQHLENSGSRSKQEIGHLRAKYQL